MGHRTPVGGRSPWEVAWGARTNAQSDHRQKTGQPAPSFTGGLNHHRAGGSAAVGTVRFGRCLVRLTRESAMAKDTEGGREGVVEGERE